MECSIPSLGLGTYNVTNKETIKSAILNLEYKLLDCASFYKNEEMIGEALSELFSDDSLNIKRDDLFIISKVWFDEIEDIEAAIKRSLQKLKVEQLDLYLVHWPVGVKTIIDPENQQKKSYQRINIPMHQVWREMERMVENGYTKQIGLSNFNLQMVWDLLSYCKIKPAFNEIELHPLNSQVDLVKFLNLNGIRQIAYCPIARGTDTSRAPNLFEDQTIVRIAEKHKVKPVQVILGWGIKRGHIVIPKSNSLERLKENKESQKVELDEQDMQDIGKLNINHRICGKYEFFFNCDIFA